MSLLPRAFAAAALAVALPLAALAQLVQPGQSGGTTPGFQASQPAPPARTALQRLRQDLGLSYYFSYLGPSPGLPIDQTYNNFLVPANTNETKKGAGPHQSFHAANLSYRLNPSWTVGATLAGIRHHTASVKCGKWCENSNDPELYNMRTYVMLPAWDFGKGVLYNTFSWEHPTSAASKEDHLKYGLVLSQTLSFKLPNPRHSAGVVGQLIRYSFKHDWEDDLPSIPGLPGFPDIPGLEGSPRQVLLATLGPYFNYQLAPEWQLATALSLDWDQNGDQKNTLHFNNNLPHRGRVAVNRFFYSSWPLSHVGVYAQGATRLADYAVAFGVDASFRF